MNEYIFSSLAIMALEKFMSIFVVSICDGQANAGFGLTDQQKLRYVNLFTTGKSES